MTKFFFVKPFVQISIVVTNIYIKLFHVRKMLYVWIKIDIPILRTFVLSMYILETTLNTNTHYTILTSIKISLGARHFVVYL